MSMVGRIIDGKYAIVRPIGEGGMGAVYEAKHQLIGHRVAVKFLHAQHATNPQVLQRFLQEAQIAGSLGHANICEVTDIGRTDDGVPYMIMPLLEGTPLAQEMKRDEGKLPTPRVFDIIYQVLTALERAHAAGVVHRDLKPENIFLTHLGDRADFVKLLDFGISKLMTGTDPGVSGLTSTGMVLGTPYYMAPEQARGSKQIDHRVDIYAVGVILYEMLTGALPFEADSYNEIIVKIVTEPFPMPRALDPSIPPEVEAVILKAMARSPEERWTTTKEFRHALMNRARSSGMGLPQYLTRMDMTGDVPLVEAHELSGETRMPTFLLPRRRWLYPTATLVAVLLGAGIAAWQPWRRAEPRPRDETREAAVPPPALADAAVPAQVRLRWTGVPKGGAVTVAGAPAPGHELRVVRARTPLPFRVAAPGYRRLEGTVVPDQDRDVPVILERTPSLPAGMGARPTPMATITRVDPPRPQERPAEPSAPPASMKVEGRGGTHIDSDYDKE
jgi:serine/threonine-protein kinase